MTRLDDKDSNMNDTRTRIMLGYRLLEKQEEDLMMCCAMQCFAVILFCVRISDVFRFRCKDTFADRFARPPPLHVVCERAMRAYPKNHLMRNPPF